MCVIPVIGFSHVNMLVKSYCFNEKAKNRFKKNGSVLRNIEECFSLLQKFVFTVQGIRNSVYPCQKQALKRSIFSVKPSSPSKACEALLGEETIAIVHVSGRQIGNEWSSFRNIKNVVL